MKILHVVGARPNFMKIAPIIAEMRRYPEIFEQRLIHTGQHYDDNMSRVFFNDLELPMPDDFLNVGSGTHAQQTAQVMMAFEPVLRKYVPDWVIVVGDVNSTMACTLVCAKMGVRVAHVEAGLRSGDRRMPEEINRIVTDQLADLLFTPSRDGDENLLREGVSPERIKFVGNVMIDTLAKMLPKAVKSDVLERLCLSQGRYILVTLHRPSNVDDQTALAEICCALSSLSHTNKLVFPLHPRTRRKLVDFGLERKLTNVLLIEPQGYLDFLSLINFSALILTDSGGVQEETTYLGVPCVTVRPNTERPVTIASGTNRLVESKCNSIIDAVEAALARPVRRPSPPEYWDASAARRIVDVFVSTVGA